MHEPFFLIFRLLAIAGDGRDGKLATNAELIQQMRADPEFLALEQSFWEHFLRTDGRRGAVSCHGFQAEILGAALFGG